MPSVNSGPSNTQTQNVTASLGNPANALATAPYVVAQVGIPVGIACTGTMGANGALTLGTALPISSPYLGGMYLYFPSGAVYSGSLAGFYFTRITSTTTGIVYNTLYSGIGPPASPSSLVLVSDPGPGAYTGVTTLQSLQLTVPPNVIGANGALQLECLLSYNNSAGTKTYSITWGGGTYFSSAPTTTQFIHVYRSILNRGVTNYQVGSNAGLYNFGAATAANLVSSQNDTTLASTMTFNMTLGAATDIMMIEFIRLNAFYSS